MNGLRKAALYLHGLSETDRLWLLDALSDEERAQLSACMEELAAMDIPNGNPWLPELAESQTFEKPRVESDDTEPELEAIDRADLAQINRALEDEPEWLIALLLKHRVWSWRQAYIGKQYLRRREQLLRALESPVPSLKPKVEKALVRALSTQLAKIASASEGFEAALAESQRKASKSDHTTRWSRIWRR